MKGLGIKKPSLKICIAEPLALPGAGLQKPMLLINWRGKLGSVKDNAKIIKIMYVTHVSKILKKGFKKKYFNSYGAFAVQGKRQSENRLCPTCLGYLKS